MCPWLTECFCPQAAATSKLLCDDGDLAEIGIASSKTIEESLKTDTGSGNGSSYKIKQLFNRHGYNLAILQGHVRGIRDAFDPRAVLQLIPIGVGEVKIQGLESGLYLAMNAKGSLYAEPDDSNEATIFLESSNGYYLHYLSKKYAHLGWYVGITKAGRAKNANKTWYPWGQKAIQFVSRKPYDEPHPLRQMQNRHGLTLAIMNNGEVKGTPEQAPANKNAILEFSPTEPTGAFRIRGIEANLYLAMDATGKLYGESDRSHGATVFAEHVQQEQYYVYLSAKFAHLGWHVGLSKSGKAKRGKRTAWGQKAIQFVRRPIVPIVTKTAAKIDDQGLAFIDEEIEDVSTGPLQVRRIKDCFQQTRSIS